MSFQQAESLQTSANHIEKATSCGTGIAESSSKTYILGTLVVKMVAARNLRAVKKGGLAGLLSGRGKSSFQAGGGSNVYGFISFSAVADCALEISNDGCLPAHCQRSSTVLNSTNPVWPRHENAYYFDVSLPIDCLVNDKVVDEPSSKEDSDLIGVKLPNATTDYRDSSNTDNSAVIDPVLSVKLYHDSGSLQKYVDDGRYPLKKDKKQLGTSENDIYLGGFDLEILDVITGRVPYFDEWIAIDTGDIENDDSDRIGSIRMIIEYEPTDPPPRVADLCHFTAFCSKENTYPIPAGQLLLVDKVLDNDLLILSYTTPEGWLSTFCVHRYMVVCSKRHQAALEIYSEEIMALTQKISQSPMKEVLGKTAGRISDDGLIEVGADVLASSINVMSKWFQGGTGVVVEDIINATNLDGRHGIQCESSSDEESSKNNVLHVEGGVEEKGQSFRNNTYINMPPCPITGESMKEPVVAADGHTYEKTAITRWFLQSDKSPLTGERLLHKEVVPNYSLMSQCSVEEINKSKDSTNVESTRSRSNSCDTTDPVASKETSNVDDIDLSTVSLHVSDQDNTVNVNDDSLNIDEIDFTEVSFDVTEEIVESNL